MSRLDDALHVRVAPPQLVAGRGGGGGVAVEAGQRVELGVWIL